MIKPLKELTLGFRSLLAGLHLIGRNPKILKWAILPFILDVIILVAVFALGGGRIGKWVDEAISWAFSDPSGSWWPFVYWPLFIFCWLTFFVVLFFFGYVLANLLASPLNSLLAEKTLEELQVIQKKPFRLRHWLKLSAKMMWTSLLKAVLFLFIGGFFFLLSFIPGIGVLASFGLVMIMSFDSVDYSFEIMGYNLQQRLRFFRQNIFFFVGSGLAIGLTLLVPGLNFLLFPAAVVGSAELLHQCLKSNERIGKVSQ